MNMQLQIMMQQFNQWTMDESLKIVTPFDMGGYAQGEGFNPSDTMAAEEDRMMHEDSMNNMDNFDSGFGGGFGSGGGFGDGF